MYVSMEGVTQTVTRDFLYDGFYRLISSTAQLHNNSITYTVQTDVTRRYSVATTFDDIHNITSKNQTVTNVNPVTVLDSLPDNSKTYNFTAYTYAAGRPHVLDDLTYTGGSRNYSFDLNGNNTGYTIPYYSVWRTWDEENRMKAMGASNPGGGYNEAYKYNESGERVTKRKGETGQATTETNYANQFMSVSRTDGDIRYVATKNYYLGMERIASQVMPVGFSGVTSAVYVYHSDHLGSTTYLTDLSGDIKEHIEYTPWGESWVENTGASFIPNYKFTGKEQDRTGLYYFGARYYDPQVSLWMSGDPILGEYLDENDGNIGRNLALNSYCHQNPIQLIDPDGRRTMDPRKIAAYMISGGALGYAAETVAAGGKPAWQNLAAGTIGGMAGGFVMATSGNGTKSGLVSASFGNVVKQTLNLFSGEQKNFSIGALVFESGIGAISGYCAEKLGLNLGSSKFLAGLNKPGQMFTMNFSRAIATQFIEGTPESALSLGMSKGIEKINDYMEELEYRFAEPFNNLIYGPTEPYRQ